MNEKSLYEDGNMKKKKKSFTSVAIEVGGGLGPRKDEAVAMLCLVSIGWLKGKAELKIGLVAPGSLTGAFIVTFCFDGTCKPLETSATGVTFVRALRKTQGMVISEIESHCLLDTSTTISKQIDT